MSVTPVNTTASTALSIYAPPQDLILFPWVLWFLCFYGSFHTRLVRRTQQQQISKFGEMVGMLPHYICSTPAISCLYVLQSSFSRSLKFCWIFWNNPPRCTPRPATLGIEHATLQLEILAFYVLRSVSEIHSHKLLPTLTIILTHL